ncbi:hypothetical protein [Aeromonas enteropelogenes]|uniref:hypothetical protein n=1 Tax=Aeromonas enteropelogenes TaxID=29489 RepID=UPI00228685D5|nr:hypothetical protein [Aeromonas enteropelogenes]MCZ0750083.1 hypothetical protein [Aeromonas enteropelogenes]
MKRLTEAQVMGFRGSMPPRTKYRDCINVELDAEARKVARLRTDTRRAIEEYHDQRARRLEMEL